MLTRASRAAAAATPRDGRRDWFDARASQLEASDPAAAEAAYRQAIALAPGYVDAYLNLGVLLCDAGRCDEAVAAVPTRRCEHCPDEALLHFNLGVALEDLERAERGAGALRGLPAARARASPTRTTTRRACTSCSATRRRRSATTASTGGCSGNPPPRGLTKVNADFLGRVAFGLTCETGGRRSNNTRRQTDDPHDDSARLGRPFVAGALAACGGGSALQERAQPLGQAEAMTVAMRVLSSAPQYVSGGDARIHVRAAPGQHDKLELWLNGSRTT